MQAFNPYLPSFEYIPDGEPRIFEGRLYVYGSHDHFNGKDFCIGDYVTWSAPLDNLGSWRYEGVIYRRNQDPQNKDSKWVMNAPDVVQGQDGRYYLYYQISRYGTVSVAVSSSPSGPFEFYGYVRFKDGHSMGTKPGEVYGFDPGVLVDDDGRVFLYVGFSPDKGFFRKLMELMKLNFDGGFGVELESDMLTVKGEPVLVAPGPILASGTAFQDHGFYEASSIRKINGLYYFVYSSILSHELCYATSSNPLGPYSFGGTIVSNGDVGFKGHTAASNYTGNTHGGMVCLNGDWYIFYHRQTNKQKCCRQGCAEKIKILDDGSIKQVEMTSCGLNKGPLKAKGIYRAYIACNLSSAKGTFPYLKSFEKDKEALHPYFTQSGQDRYDNDDQYIANMTCGSWAGFKYFNFDSDCKISISIRASNNITKTVDGKMEVYTDLSDSPCAVIQVKFGSADVAWQKTRAVELKKTNGALRGVKPLFFVWKGTAPIDFYSFELA